LQINILTMPKGIYDGNKTSQEVIDKVRSYPDDMTHSEIARECGVSNRTVTIYRGASPHPSWCKIVDGRGGKMSRKLRRDEVEHIRRTARILSADALARQYNVSISCIYAVRQGRTYREWLE
jgi:hypothetical protein